MLLGTPGRGELGRRWGPPHAKFWQTGVVQRNLLWRRDPAPSAKFGREGGVFDLSTVAIVTCGPPGPPPIGGGLGGPFRNPKLESCRRTYDRKIVVTNVFYSGSCNRDWICQLNFLIQAV